MAELRDKKLGWIVDSLPFEFSKNTGMPKDLLTLTTSLVTTGNCSIQVRSSVAPALQRAYSRGGGSGFQLDGC